MIVSFNCQVDLLITPEFVWKDRFHGAALRWWLIVEVLNHVFFLHFLEFYQHLYITTCLNNFVAGLRDSSWLEKNPFIFRPLTESCTSTL